MLASRLCFTAVKISYEYVLQKYLEHSVKFDLGYLPYRKYRWSKKSMCVESGVLFELERP